VVDDRSGVDVVDAAARCIEAGELTGLTARRVTPTIEHFVAYLEHNGVGSLDSVSTELADRFVRSRLDSGIVASLATQHNRRTAIRFLFRVARRLDLASGDPTLDIVLPPATSLATRPLVDDEIELCRDISWWKSSRVARQVVLFIWCLPSAPLVKHQPDRLSSHYRA